MQTNYKIVRASASFVRSGNHAIYAIQNLFVLEWSCYVIMSVNVDI